MYCGGVFCLGMSLISGVEEGFVGEISLGRVLFS